MFDRKAVFNLSLSSALSLALISSSDNFLSCVISFLIARKFTSTPCSLSIGDIIDDSQYSSPFFLWLRTSPAHASPRLILLQISSQVIFLPEFTQSSLIFIERSSTKENPVSVQAAGFAYSISPFTFAIITAFILCSTALESFLSSSSACFLSVISALNPYHVILPSGSLSGVDLEKIH